MNNKGFTLIELLACIVILSLITFLAYPQISKYIKNNEIKKYELEEENIVSNMELYNLDNEEKLWNGNSEINVTIEDLKTSNRDLKIDDKCNIDYLKIIKIDNKYDYKACIRCGNIYVSGDC